MGLSSGIEPNAEMSGAPYIQNALATRFGGMGFYFITFALILFAFTTLIGNLYYVDNNLAYINGKVPSKTFMTIYRIVAVLIIFVGATQEAGFLWDLGDLLMGIMALINLPSILMLGGVTIKALKDYASQKSQGKNPVFVAKNIGVDEKEAPCWK